MHKILKCIYFLFVLGVSGFAYGQSSDLARVEYTYFPQSDSDNSFRRIRALINFPLKLNDKGAYLIPGIDYGNINLKYADPARFGVRDLERFQSFTFSLGYTSKISKDWRFGGAGGLKIASNFEMGDILSDDLIYTGTVIFIKTKEDERYVQPWRLILGLQYSTTSGIPFPLPIINYFKRFVPQWSYTLGVPKTSLKHHLNEKSSIQGFVTLDGFFANVQENFNITPDNPGTGSLAENVSMTIVLGGIGYEYDFTDNFSFYLYAGHTLINDIRLRDHNLNTVYTINEQNSFYGRGGLKFSIL